MKLIALILGAALGAANSGVLHAENQNPEDQQGRRPWAIARGCMFKTADTDGDGTLNEAERKAAREAWQNRQRQ